MLLFVISRENISAYNLVQVITSDAAVSSDVWRKMVRIAVDRSFNQITVCLNFDWLAVPLESMDATLVDIFVFLCLQVDGDTSTNDTVIALASGLSGLPTISSLESREAVELQACLDAVTNTCDSYIKRKLKCSVLQTVR